MFKLHWTRIKKKKIKFAVYDSDTPVTLKQRQDPQTCYESVDSKQDYNQAKFEKLRWNTVHKKANIKSFVK